MSDFLVREYWDKISAQQWDAAQNLLHPRFIAEWPQSRERFDNPADYIQMNREYPGTHRVEVVHVIAQSDRAAATVYIHAQDTGQKTFATSWFEFKDGKIVRLTEFWAEPYAAPEARSRWARVY